MPDSEDLDRELKQLGQLSLVLQGGGALGAYQAGVFQALHEAEVEPDWLIGTSIGAINAALIAGASPDHRMARVRAFWDRVEHTTSLGLPMLPWLAADARNFIATAVGVPDFYRPNPLSFLSPHWLLGAEHAGYYDVEPLRRILTELVDWDQLNNGEMRLTVGASDVRSCQMRYFDSRDMRITVDHILASGALPPAFPPVRIDGELYWDGGILSNTPVEAVFDDTPRRSGVVFAVHIWNPHGGEPDSMWKVLNRHKDIQYSSRDAALIKRQREIHRLRRVVAELGALVGDERRGEARVAELVGHGCLTRTHVVRLLAPALPGDDHRKDLDFSPETIRHRWDAGYRHTLATLRRAPWRDPVDEAEGFVVHEAEGGEMVATAVAAEGV